MGYSLRPRTSGATGSKFYNNFTVNGVANNYSYKGSTSTNTIDNAFGFSGVAITLAVVPEPSAFGMVLIGALGLVGFRRLGFRRS